MEIVQDRTGRTPGHEGEGWPFARPDPAAGFVTLTSGVYQEVVTAGQAVSELRAQHGVSLDLDPQARAVVNGLEVSDSYRPKPSETVVWTRRAGEKGGEPAR